MPFSRAHGLGQRYAWRSEELQKGLELWVSQFKMILNIIEYFIFGLFLLD